MTKRCEKLLAKARHHPAGLRFAEARRLAECLGWTFAESREAITHTRAEHFANLQPRSGGKAKPYQVRQLLKIAHELESEAGGSR